MLRKSQARTGCALDVVNENDDCGRYRFPEIPRLRVRLWGLWTRPLSSSLPILPFPSASLPLPVRRFTWYHILQGETETIQLGLAVLPFSSS